MDIALIVLIILALAFDLLNGIHDSSNIVATMISSRALSPMATLTITALAHFFGPFIFGVAVAKTIGDEIVISGSISVGMIIAALIAAILWNLLTWWLGMPSSSSHALIGGLLGAVATGAGWQVIKFGGIEKILLALFVSPIIGFVGGWLITKIIYLLCWNSSPKVNWVFKKTQIITSIALALSHGTNDAQKTMGIITLALVSFHALPTFEVPFWVILGCALTMGLGTMAGGWRNIRTMGNKMIKLKPVHGFAAETSAAVVILGASHFGIPISTTHIISTAIMGVGSTRGLHALKWGIVGNIVMAWVLTIPTCMLIAAVLYRILPF